MCLPPLFCWGFTDRLPTVDTFPLLYLFCTNALVLGGTQCEDPATSPVGCCIHTWTSWLFCLLVCRTYTDSSISWCTCPVPYIHMTKVSYRHGVHHTLDCLNRQFHSWPHRLIVVWYCRDQEVGASFGYFNHGLTNTCIFSSFQHKNWRPLLPVFCTEPVELVM